MASTSSLHIDPSLITALRSGHESALKTLLELAGPKLLNYCRKKGMADSDAEELIQDVFLKLWQFREKLDASANFEAFIFTIARNAIINFARKQADYELTPTGHLEDAVAPASWDVHRISYEEVYHQYLRIMAQADEKRREAFRLSREEGMTHKQIAEELGISVRTVEFYISAMLKMLRMELKDGYILLVLFLFQR